MAQQNITIDSYNMNDSTVVTEKINVESLSVDQSKMKIPHRAGEKRVSKTYATRPITIEGKIISTTASGLDGKIDELKQNTIGKEDVPLDIDYAGGTRRFTVNVLNAAFIREHYNNTMVPYSMQIEATNPPYGQDTTSVSGYAGTTISGSFIITSSGMYATGAVTISGTAAPEPTIEFIVNVAGSMRSLQFTNLTTNTSLIVIPTSLSNGDRIQIDTRNLEVRKNSTVITTYSGTFPLFQPGVNNFTVNVFGTSPNYTFGLDITYTKWWL